MSRIKVICIFAIIFFGANSVKGQLKVDTTDTEDFLVKEILLGKGVLIGDVSYKGPKFAIAHFRDSLKTVNIPEGILLSSGNVYYSLGPNRSPRTGWASNTPGDEDLDGISHGRTHDASVLEFDFITQSENLSFQYVFASEEYQEYVGSKFNDVFGFFLSGPNADHVNLALLPDGKTPITINNVNHEQGKSFYVDNPYFNTTDPFIWDVRKRKVVKNKKYQKQTELPEYNIQYDGFTVVLTAKYKVIPNEIYHIKMAIADVADGILDSGVFLAAGSFQSTGEEKIVISKRFPEIESQGEIDQIPAIHQKTEDIVNDQPKDQESLDLPMVLHVEFPFDSYQLSDDSLLVIEEVFSLLRLDPEIVIDVVGHTDSEGSNGYNLELSRLRSETVIKHLLKIGVNISRITSYYLGEARPVRTNSSAEGRAKNRRVEIVLKKQTASLD